MGDKRGTAEPTIRKVAHAESAKGIRTIYRRPWPRSNSADPAEREKLWNSRYDEMRSLDAITMKGAAASSPALLAELRQQARNDPDPGQREAVRGMLDEMGVSLW